MPRAVLPPYPGLDRKLRGLGERIKLARLRRHVSAVLFSERLGVSRTTLSRLEAGEASISIGTYFHALRILGFDKDIDLLAADDPVGRQLQDGELARPRNTSRR